MSNASYTVTMPDGASYTVSGPADKLTPDIAKERAKQMHAAAKRTTAPPTVPPTAEPTSPLDQKVGGFNHMMEGVGRGMIGSADLATTFATSAVAAPVAFGTGIVGSVLKEGPLDATAADAAAIMNATQQLFTWSPKTAEGQAVMEGLGKLLQPVAEKLQQAADVITDDRDKQQLLLGALDAMPGNARAGLAVLRKKSAVTGTVKEIVDLQKRAEKLGLELDDSAIKPSLGNVAAKLAEGDNDKTLQDLGNAVRASKGASTAEVDDAFDMARKTSSVKFAYVPLREAVDKAETALLQSGVDLRKNPHLQSLMADFKKLDTTIPASGTTRPGQGAAPTPPAESIDDVFAATFGGKQRRDNKSLLIPYQDIDVLMKRLNTELKRTRDNPTTRVEHGELAKFKTSMRTYLDGELDRIARGVAKSSAVGDVADVAQWRKAYTLARKHASKFYDDQTVARILADPGISADAIRELLLGQYTLGGKGRSLPTIKKLKEILGPDSPEMEAIRDAAYAQLFDPLFKDNPSYAGVVNNLHRAKTYQSDFLKEIGVDMDDLDLVRRAAHVAKNVVDPKDLLDVPWLSVTGMRVLMGHGLTRATAKLNFTQRALEKTLGLSKRTHAQMLREFHKASDELRQPVAKTWTQGARARAAGVMAYGAAVAGLEEARDAEGDDD